MSSPYLESLFQNLRDGRYEIKSHQTVNYNCIAWAATETHRKWWPVGAYWPPNVPREETVPAFILAFATRGYEQCDNGVLEDGYEKVVIYVDSSQTPTHMARQLSSGQWTSKLGDLEDIEHETLRQLEEGHYGRAIQYLKRPVANHKRAGCLTLIARGLLHSIWKVSISSIR